MSQMTRLVGLLERREDRLGMAVDLDLGENLLDHAVASDDEGGALDTHELAAVKRLHLIDAVRLGDGIRGIAEQRKVERLLRDELHMRGGRVGTDANDLRAQRANVA